MTVNDESRIDEVLRATHEAGGKLISVNPIRRSLEDLFVEQTKD